MPTPPNLFGYIGGKYNYASKLIPLFPEHTRYVEVFGGAGNVLIQKPLFKAEVFNDINSDIVNLFRVLRTDYDAFIEKIENVPYSREEFFAFSERLKTETDALQRAVMWYAVANMNWRAGRFGTPTFKTAIPKMRRGPAFNFKNKTSRLHEIRDRLRDVIIENKDFASILDLYDSEDTFFYLDPPYLPETRKSTNDYQHEMSYEDHERLIDILKGIKGKAMLSGYSNELYEALEWTTYSFETVAYSALVKNRKKPKRTEMVYMNYEGV